MIRIDMIQQDTRHPDKRRQHQGRASCEVAGHRFETEGPAPIYRMATLLWFHGHFGEKFEVWDDLSPFGNPGGLAMFGKVRNWARIVKGKPVFDKDAPSTVEFSSHDRMLVAQAAGRVVDLTETDSAGSENDATAPLPASDGPDHPTGPDRASTGVFGARPPEAA